MLIRNVCLFVYAKDMYYPTVSMHQRDLMKGLLIDIGDLKKSLFMQET